MKRIKIGVLGLVILFMMGSSAGAAVVLGITDNFSKTGFDIDYSLSYDPAEVGAPPYSARFTIVDSSNSGDFTNGPWTITGFYFKFFEGSPPILLSDEAGFSIQNPEDGFWGYKFNSPFVLGTGGSLTLDFTFQDGAFALKEDEVNFKVLYVGGIKQNGGNYTGQLSDYLRVPEPSGIFLLSAGLVGLVVYRRKKRMH